MGHGDLYTRVTAYLWGFWGIYWLYAARISKPVIQAQGRWERGIHLGQVVLTFLLLFAGPLYVGPFSLQIWPRNDLFGSAGLVLTAVGIGWMVWARVYLGGNWSANVTLKKDHELIQGGPYAITRHPIYTGFIVGVSGVALTVGQVRSVLAVVIIIYAFSVKLLKEEALLRSQFPKEYEEYAQRVKRLIPFLY